MLLFVSLCLFVLSLLFLLVVRLYVPADEEIGDFINRLRKWRR